MKLAIVIQISFVSVAGWLHLHVGNVSLTVSPRGSPHTDAAFLIASP